LFVFGHGSPFTRIKPATVVDYLAHDLLIFMPVSGFVVVAVAICALKASVLPENWDWNKLSA
jgi:hypothetical protein